MNEERELLNIYRGILDILQLVDKVKSVEELMELYAEYLKLQVQISTNKPVFQLCPEGFRYGNCYTYALDLKCPDVFWNKSKEFYSRGSMGFDPGIVTSKKRVCIHNSSEEILLDSFYKDCEGLNLEVYDRDLLCTSPKCNGFIIYMYKNIYIKHNYDFHFVRINVDGTLSNRNGFNDSITILDSLSYVSKMYELIGAFEIVKPVIREKTLYVGR